MPERVKLAWTDRESHYGLVPRRDRGPFEYLAFIPDPVKDFDQAIDGATAARVEAAAKACAQLDLSPGIDDLEPVARLLLRAESVASSRIEGLHISHRRLEEATFEPKAARGMALSIIKNIDAMNQAVAIAERGDDLTVADLVEIHRTLLYTERDQAIAGVIRTEQSWIGGGVTPKRADFVPPPPDRVESLLEDLVAFCNRGDISAITQAAVAHAQFETIHPFVDGNGRTGRCLIHIVLRRRGLSARVVPPISVVLAADANGYVQGLTDFRNGDIGAWVTRFGAATATAGTHAIELGEDFRDLRLEWEARLGKTNKGSTIRELVAGLAQHPMVSAESVQAQFGVSDQTARDAIDRLVACGVLTKITAGKRNRAFAALEVFGLLDEFDIDIRGKDHETP